MAGKENIHFFPFFSFIYINNLIFFLLLLVTNFYINNNNAYTLIKKIFALSFLLEYIFPSVISFSLKC